MRAGLFTIPGDGCIDYAPILDFVRDSDYRGWLIIEAEQDPAMAPPLATASRAYAWLAHHLSSPSSSEEMHHERAVKYRPYRLRFYGAGTR